MGRRSNRREDENLPVAEAGPGGQFEFVEWTPDKHLRHSRFVALGANKIGSDERTDGK